MCAWFTCLDDVELVVGRDAAEDDGEGVQRRLLDVIVMDKLSCVYGL